MMMLLIFMKQGSLPKTKKINEKPSAPFEGARRFLYQNYHDDNGLVNFLNLPDFFNIFTAFRRL